MYEQFYRNYQPIPQMQVPQVPQYQQPAPAPDERIWVQNKTAADAYLIAPGGFVRLWSATEPVFYEKRADATGRPLPMDVYEYTKRTSGTVEPVKNETIDYKSEIEALKERIEALEQKGTVKTNAKRKSDTDDTDA